jgi:hypothetical protein
MVVERRNRLASDSTTERTGSPLHPGFVMCPVYGTAAMIGSVQAIYQWAYLQALTKTSAAQPTAKWPPTLNMN